MKTKKLKRDKIAKITSRIALIVMCFMLIVPFGVSAASAPDFTVNITNPNNIPQDIQFSSAELSFGINEISNFYPVSFSHIDYYGSGSSATYAFFTFYEGDILKTVRIYLGPSLASGENPQLTANVDYIESLDYSRLYAISISADQMYDLNFSTSGYLFHSVDGYQNVYFFNTSVINLELSEYNNTPDYDTKSYIILVYLPEPEPPTTPILDVWTGITNWISSSLLSIQGLFYEIGTPFTELGEPTDFVYDGHSYNLAISDPTLLDNIYYNGSHIVLEQTAVDIDGSIYYALTYDNIAVALVDLSGDFGYVINDPSFTIGNSGLTFLGTITIIGVSIACAFLIIGIIQRFLKLRG